MKNKAGKEMRNEFGCQTRVFEGYKIHFYIVTTIVCILYKGFSEKVVCLFGMRGMCRREVIAQGDEHLPPYLVPHLVRHLARHLVPHLAPHLDRYLVPDLFPH